MSTGDVVEPDWETWEPAAGTIADEILLRWGGASDVEDLVEFAAHVWREHPSFWSEIWSRPVQRVSPEDRRRIVDAWDRWRQ